MSQALPLVSVAEQLAERIAELQAGALQRDERLKSERGAGDSVPSPQGGGGSGRACGEGGGQLSNAARRICELLVLDVIGLAVAARNERYAKAAIDAWEDDGPCTAIGHGRTLTAAG